MSEQRRVERANIEIKQVAIFTDLEAVAGRVAATGVASQSEAYRLLSQALVEYTDSQHMAALFGVHEMAKELAGRTAMTYPEAVRYVLANDHPWSIAQSVLMRPPEKPIRYDWERGGFNWEGGN